MTLPVIPADAQIIILGEVHDNPQHHLTQAAYIRALQPSAVAFEMLTPKQAAVANGMSARDTDLRDALEWSESGWPEWRLYQPVFEALGDARIYGMALSNERVRRAVTEGAAALFEGDATAFDLLAPLPEQQQAAREAHQQDAHCNMLPPGLLGGMIEAQRLRDAAFARTSLDALAQTGGPVVVITGTGHARKDWGMPAAISQASAATVVVSVGQLETSAQGESFADTPPYDIRLFADPVPREDPCAGFKMMDRSPGS
ncbi:MAG: putative iron-regulated protein [Glaciecola sp.]|uniref:ChaN family lipoprotein n=1 Tax=Congregibacter sp. TaxID=2744308 RepID=UPI0039E57360